MTTTEVRYWITDNRHWLYPVAAFVVGLIVGKLL